MQPALAYNYGMPLLVDGHNLIGKLPDISFSDPDKEARLIALLRRYCGRTNRKVTVVFDRGAPAGHWPSGSSKLEVVFAPTSRTADEIIIRRIAQSRNPAGLVVVSSDGEVAAAALARRAHSRRAEDFARELAALAAQSGSSGRDRQLSADEVAEWEAIFRNRDEHG
ncbi:MAG: NYN domain-containing protein [Anaerolineales bacterium]